MLQRVAILFSLFLAAAAPVCAHPTLSVTPVTSLADTPVKIVARGLAPHERVRIAATTTDASGERWSSKVSCASDSHGVVNLDRCAPESGTYDRTDGMGLFWSMHPSTSDGFFTAPDTSERYLLILSSGNRIVARTEARRVFAARGVKRRQLPAPLVGNAYEPAGPGTHPAVILLGGSGGGHPMDGLAAILASHGYEAVSLAYYGETRLPKALRAIPVETVGQALMWLARQPQVDANRIAIIGHSRGSELALYAAVTYPKIRAAIALAGSAVMWPALDRSNPVPAAAWTVNGVPLPYVSYDERAASQVNAAAARDHVIRLEPLFHASLQQTASVDKATIPIERINGPVLLLSGSDDAMWPSTTFAAMAMARLKAHHHAYRDEAIQYPAAGHWMFEPYIPVDGRIILNNPYSPLDFGGTAPGDAIAAVDAWHRILNFLNTSLSL